MKNKTFIGVTSLIIIMLLVGGWNLKRVDAVSEMCSGVATEFTATYPTSVIAGQAVSLTDISSRPAASYGYTITSSTLSLSATGAAPTTYSSTNTSTNPSPTTGAPTYTAYYPNWALTASGAAGSQVIIKLTSATAVVSGIGPIVCPLTQTLATINITSSPPASGGTSNTPSTTTTQTPSSNEAAKTNSTPGSQNQDVPKNTENTDAATLAAKTKAELAKDEQTKAMPLSFAVVNKNGDALEGAKVTIDNQLTVATSKDGIAKFTGIRAGKHQVSISYGGRKIEQTIKVGQVKGSNDLKVIFPTKSYLIFEIIAGIIVMVILLASGLLLIRKRKALRTLRINNSPAPLTSSAVTGTTLGE